MKRFIAITCLAIVSFAALAGATDLQTTEPIVAQADTPPLRLPIVNVQVQRESVCRYSASREGRFEASGSDPRAASGRDPLLQWGRVARARCAIDQ